MTLRWFTDQDREAMRHAKDARRVLDELYLKYAKKAEVEASPAMLRIEGFQIRPYPPEQGIQESS